MASQGGDGEQPNSMDEARRNHLKTLHRRNRFRAKLIADDGNDATPNPSNEQQASSSQTIHPNLLPQAAHQPFPCSQPVNAQMNFNSYAPPPYPYSRRYSLATYHPVFIQGVPMVAPHVPFYFPPQLPPNFYHLPDRGRIGSETVPQVTQTDDDGDDDVFATASAPQTAPYLHNDALNTILHQERRKRARSAGEMGARYSHQIQNMFGVSLPPPSPIQQSPFEVKNNHSHVIVQPHVERKATTDFVVEVQPPTKRKCIEASSSVAAKPSTAIQSSSQSTSEASPPQELTTGGTSTPQSTPQHVQTSNVVTPVVLKSSLATSRSSAVKKKVIWNDLPNEDEKTSSSSDDNTLNIISKSSPELVTTEAQVVTYKPETVQNRIGPYLIGPKLGPCPVKCVSQYLVRKANTSTYYMAKLLSIDSNSSEVRSGKMLLHNEHSLLSLLSSHPGVIRHHGLFKDSSYCEERGTVIPRVGLILDCLSQHEQDPSTNNYLNLQQYVIQTKRLSEREATRIFYLIVSVVYSLHQINVVHRDLKLGNMVLDKRVRRVTLTNFCLGCHLSNEREMLTDQRGSPAYISPDVLSGKPYAGKPSDMWSLGVVLYTMLYGQFPFYDPKPKVLFSKIKHAKYNIPVTGTVSVNTNEIIQGLLTLDPKHRLTAAKVLAKLTESTVSWKHLRAPTTPAQVVPDIDDEDFQEKEEVEDTLTKQDKLRHEQLLTYAFERKLLSDDELDDNSR